MVVPVLLASMFMILARRCKRFFIDRIFVIVALVFSFFIPLAVTAAATKDVGRVNSDSRVVLFQAVNGLVSAWNRYDAERITQLFLPDAELVMPDGKVARSRAGIRRKLLEEWRGRLQDTTLSHAVEDVAVLDGSTAVVKGKYRLNGVKILGLEKSPEGAFIIEHKKQRGRWMISKAQLLHGQADSG